MAQPANLAVCTLLTHSCHCTRERHVLISAVLWLQANPTATAVDMLVFINAVLSDGLAAEEAARARSQADAIAATSRQSGAVI